MAAPLCFGRFAASIASQEEPVPAMPGCRHGPQPPPSTILPSPNGNLAASVQHQVCETAAGGVASAVTVFVGAAAAPLQGTRRVAQRETDLQSWMAGVSRWNELRQRDLEKAGPRPARPEEPRATPRPCRDSDISP